MYNIAAGLRTEFGTMLPPGGKIAAYVHHSGAGITDDQEIVKRLRPSVAAAASLCRAGKGDAIVVLPGHTESFAVADSVPNLVAGTLILGAGYGTNRPTFNWTAAGSTCLLNVANVTIANCQLNLDSGTTTATVAAPITVSAAGCRLIGNSIRMGTDADSNVTIGITTTADADDFEMIGNFIYGATAAETTTMIQFVGADRLKFIGNTVIGATSSVAVGVIRFLTTASLDILMLDNRVYCTKAASTAAITGMTGTTGIVDHLLMGTLANGANQLVLGHADGAWADNADGMIFGLNVGVVNLAGEAAARATPLSA